MFAVWLELEGVRCPELGVSRLCGIVSSHVLVKAIASELEGVRGKLSLHQCLTFAVGFSGAGAFDCRAGRFRSWAVSRLELIFGEVHFQGCR